MTKSLVRIHPVRLFATVPALRSSLGVSHVPWLHPLSELLFGEQFQSCPRLDQSCSILVRFLRDFCSVIIACTRQQVFCGQLSCARKMSSTNHLSTYMRVKSRDEHKRRIHEVGDAALIRHDAAHAVVRETVADVGKKTRRGQQRRYHYRLEDAAKKMYRREECQKKSAD